MKKQDEEENLKGMLLKLMTFLPVLLAFLLLIILVNVAQLMALSLCTFLTGFSGVIIVIRKEIPMAHGSVTGKSAVIQGSVFTIINWLFAIYFAITALK